MGGKSDNIRKVLEERVSVDCSTKAAGLQVATFTLSSKKRMIELSFDVTVMFQDVSAVAKMYSQIIIIPVL